MTQKFGRVEGIPRKVLLDKFVKEFPEPLAIMDVISSLLSRRFFLHSGRKKILKQLHVKNRPPFIWLVSSFLDFHGVFKSYVWRPSRSIDPGKKLAEFLRGGLKRRYGLPMRSRMRSDFFNTVDINFSEIIYQRFRYFFMSVYFLGFGVQFLLFYQFVKRIFILLSEILKRLFNFFV